MVISSGISNASMRTVSLRLRRIEYSTRSFASLSNRAPCIGSYHSTSIAGRNQMMLPASDKFRCESAIESILKGKRALLLLDTQDGRAGERSLHDVLVRLRLLAAGAICGCGLR